MRAPIVSSKRARALRRELTLPDVLLWQDLRRVQGDGLRFRRQHAVDPYMLDFSCAAGRLAVEVDGTAHDVPSRAERDLRRDAWPSGQGIRVLRIRAVDVLSNVRRPDVLATVAAAVAPSTASGGPPPP